MRVFLPELGRGEQPDSEARADHRALSRRAHTEHDHATVNMPIVDRGLDRPSVVRPQLAGPRSWPRNSHRAHCLDRDGFADLSFGP